MIKQRPTSHDAAIYLYGLANSYKISKKVNMNEIIAGFGTWIFGQECYDKLISNFKTKNTFLVRKNDTKISNKDLILINYSYNELRPVVEKYNSHTLIENLTRPNFQIVNWDNLFKRMIKKASQPQEENLLNESFTMLANMETCVKSPRPLVPTKELNNQPAPIILAYEQNCEIKDLSEETIKNFVPAFIPSSDGHGIGKLHKCFASCFSSSVKENDVFFPIDKEENDYIDPPELLK